MIDPAFDSWVWGTAMLVLVLLGIRAWVVETGRGRHGRTPVKVRVLTGVTATVLGVLVVMLTVQGGAQLAQTLITGTDTAGQADGPAGG